MSYAALTALMQVFVALRADEAMVVKTISDWLDSNFKLFVDILLKHLTYGSNHMQVKRAYYPFY